MTQPVPRRPATGRTTRTRNYCFVLNNYSAQHARILLSFCSGADPHVIAISNYIVMQEEIAPTTGTRHLQGYMEFRRAIRKNNLKRKLVAAGIPNTIHLERRHGTQAEAIAYCKKPETRPDNGQQYEHGTPKPPGRPQGEHSTAVEAVMADTPMTEVAEAYPKAFVKHHQGLKALTEIRAKPRKWAMEIIIYYGPTGTGKSFMAHKDRPEAYDVTWPEKGGWWWPNYHGQATCIMDEFRHQISLDKMLQIMDRYPLTLQYKGGNTKFRSETLIITSNIPPHEWYPKVRDVTMLRRRIKQFATIYKFGPDEWEPQDPEQDEPPMVEEELLDRVDPETLDFTGGRAEPSRQGTQVRDNIDIYG